MRDKELKHLKREDLIEVIYELRTLLDEYQSENKRLSALLADKNAKLEHAGSIAEASLALTRVFEEAQEAADIYLEQIKAKNEEADLLLEKAAARAGAANVSVTEPDETDAAGDEAPNEPEASEAKAHAKAKAA